MGSMRDSESEASYGVGEGNITMLKYLELENFKSYRGAYENFCSVYFIRVFIYKTGTPIGEKTNETCEIGEARRNGDEPRAGSGWVSASVCFLIALWGTVS